MVAYATSPARSRGFLAKHSRVMLPMHDARRLQAERARRVGPARVLHDYAMAVYSHAPMATVRQVSASNPSQPPVSGLERP